MNNNFDYLICLTKKDQKSVPIPIQHKYTFPYFKNKIQFSVPWQSEQKVNYKLKIDPKIFMFRSGLKMAHPIHPKNGTSYTSPIYGSYLLPIQQGKNVWENLVSILWAIGLLQDILCLIFNFANDLLMVYRKTRK